MDNKNHFKEGNKLEYDPVCGMKIDPSECKDSLQTISFKGKDYYFCSPFCTAVFTEDPERYLSLKSKSEGDENKDENTE